MFFIGFVTGARMNEEGLRYAEGELTLGRDRERFRSDLGTWSTRDYETQWHEAISRLLSGKSSSVLITSYRGPEAGDHLAWPMWREGPTICFQKGLLLTEQLPRPFDPAMIYDLVGDRRAIDEAGGRLPEWRVPLEQLATFILDE